MRRPPRPPRPLRARRLLAVAMLVPLLAGCGGAPQASDPPSASPSPSMSPSESPSGEASQPRRPLTRAGARAFVLDYVGSLNRAMSDGNIEAISELDDSSCKSCDSTLAAISRIYDDGGRIEGGSWSPRVIDQLARDDGWVVDVELTFAPQKVRAAARAKLEEFEGGKGLASFIVSSRSGAWQVDEWTRAE